MANGEDTSPERIQSLEERVEALVTRVDALLCHLEGSGATLSIPSSARVDVPSSASRCAMSPAVLQPSVQAPITPQPSTSTHTQAPVAATPAQVPIPSTPLQAQAPLPATAPTPAPAPVRTQSPPVPQSPVAPRGQGSHLPKGQVPPAVKGTMMPSLKDASSSRLIVLLLSGLAALLVILAATSLIALLWDSIPNWVKVLTLGLVAIAMTASGALWHKREAHPSIPPATLTGIGTGLGYLTGIGAALLEVLPPIGAFLVLLVWTIATTALATLSKMPFTLIATAIGGVLTLSLLYSHALGHPSQALLVEGLILAYSAACLVSSTIASRPLHGAFKRWTIASSAAATVPALLFVPVEASSKQSSLGTYIMSIALAVLALVTVAFLVREPEQREWQWVWTLAPLVVIISYLSLTSIAATEEERLFLSLVHFLLCLGLIGFAATPKLSGPVKGFAEYALLAPPIFFPLLDEVGVVTITTASYKTLVDCAAWFVILACAALATQQRSSSFLVILPIVALYRSFDFTMETFSVIFIILTLLIATVLIDRALKALPWQRAFAMWLGIFGLIFKVPWEIVSQIPKHSTYRNALEVSVIFLVFLVVALLLILGLATPNIGPADLWMGRRLIFSSTAGDSAATSRTTSFSPASPAPMSAAPATGFGQPPGMPRRESGGVFAPLSVLMTLFFVSSVTYILPLMLLSSVWNFLFGLPSASSTPLDLVVSLGMLILALAFVLAMKSYATHSLYGILIPLVLVSVVWQAFNVIRALDNAPWVATLMVLLVGAAAIVLGFRWKAPNMRLTSLVIVIIAVFKLSLIDTGFNDSISRVLSLLIAGLICFALSVLYSKLSAKARAKETLPSEYFVAPGF